MINVINIWSHPNYKPTELYKSIYPWLFSESKLNMSEEELRALASSTIYGPYFE